MTTAGEVGSFTCKVNIPAALAGEQTLYAIYDAASVVDANAVHHNVYQDNSVRATIPQVQTCTSTSFDPAADVLFAKPVTTTLVAEGDNEVTMQFGRPVSIIKLNVTSSATTIPAGTNLKGIKLTAGDTDYLTGYAQLDITGTTAPSAGISKWVSNSSYNNVTVQKAEPFTLSSTAETFWVSVGASALHALTIEVLNDNPAVKISKTINLSSYTDGLALNPGGLKTMNISLSDDDVTVSNTRTYNLLTHADDLTAGAKIIIVNAEGNEALGAQSSNGNNRVEVDCTVKNNAVEVSEDDKISIIEVQEEGDKYVFISPEGYLYAANGNYLKSENNPSEINDNYKWTVAIASNGVATITNVGQNTRTIRYNSSNKLFACYTSGQGDVKIFYIPGTPQPKLSVSAEELTWAADATDAQTVTVTAKDADGNAAEWSYALTTGIAADWNITKTGNDLSIAPKAASEKTAVITVTSFDGLTKTIALSQAAASSGNGIIAEFIFNTEAGLNALGISIPNKSAGTNITTTLTSNGVSMTATHGGTNTRVWNSNGEYSLRVYKTAGSLKFTAPTGMNITKVEITGSTVNGFSANVGNYSNGTWSGSANSVTFTASTTNQTVDTITVTYK